MVYILLYPMQISIEERKLKLSIYIYSYCCLLYTSDAADDCWSV